jgi:Reverse transcriptase (RNA-dependent DNA polymerase)
MYLRDGVYIKGTMVFNLDTSSWRFSQCRRNGTEIWGTDLPQLSRDFQLYIDDGLIIPGWHNNSYFLQSGRLPVGAARHVSATGLTKICAPGSSTKAFHPSHPDRGIWVASYNEEYDGLNQNDTFELISEEDYQAHCRAGGKRAIPSMAVFTIKMKDGVPVRAKCRIVVLGNKDPSNWSKADCYAPVVSLPVVRLLTALAVKHRRPLKQGDCKNAFVQAVLPDDEGVIVRPPPGCFRTRSGFYWRLKKSLYGLRRAPRHWYKLISSILTSPEISLKQCKNDPCVFIGTPLPGQPPLFLILYVDDFVYFSPSAEVEAYFESALSQKMKVDFLGDAEWFLGMKFDWSFDSHDHLHCRISQEGYVQAIVDEMGLSNANTCPSMTPFRSGLSVDSIPIISMNDSERAPLIKKNAVLAWHVELVMPGYTTGYCYYHFSFGFSHSLSKSWSS